MNDEADRQQPNQASEVPCIANVTFSDRITTLLN